MDYIRCMTITPNVNPAVYTCLSIKDIEAIDAYIQAPMTATTFSEDKSSTRNREIITAEIIYYWMTALQIPFEPCENWHLNRLLTLIRVGSVKNAPQKKMNRKDIMNQNAALNAARRRQLGSRG